MLCSLYDLLDVFYLNLIAFTKEGILRMLREDLEAKNDCKRKV